MLGQFRETTPCFNRFFNVKTTWKSNVSWFPFSPGSSEHSGSSKSLEQEKYLSAIVLNTPYGSAHKSDSLVSLNAILPPTNSGETPDGTPTISPRKGQHGSGTLLQRGFLRSSGGQKVYGQAKSGGELYLCNSVLVKTRRFKTQDLVKMLLSCVIALRLIIHVLEI